MHELMIKDGNDNFGLANEAMLYQDCGIGASAKFNRWHLHHRRCESVRLLR